jgi:O-succinylbenzoate synthase
MTAPVVAVLSGSLTIRLTPSQLASLLQQWQRDGMPGDKLTLQLMPAN